MIEPPSFTNTPIWNSATRGAFQEVWYLKLNEPQGQRSLWLRFTLLVSANGFRRLAETWAVASERKETREISHLAIKQSYEIRAFSQIPDGIKIGDCELTSTGTRGSIQSKGKILKWDFKIMPGFPSTPVNLVPVSLAKMGVIKNTVITLNEDLRFTGTYEVDGKTVAWADAPGMQAHLSGQKNGHSWVWGQSNIFLDEAGRPVPFFFEGLTARGRMGMVPTPPLSSFYFRYRDQDYRFNSLWDSVRSRSHHSFTNWEFQADRGDLSFHGKMRAELRDFAGVTYEDTDGSLLYCANSKLSELTILVYRSGKLEATLKSLGTAAFEVVSRQKHPYVPMLI